MKIISGKIKKVIENNVILDNGPFSFSYGKIYLINGESGTGKTTFLNIITCIDNEFEGEVTYNIIDKKKDVFYIHQKMEFSNDFSIKEWMIFFKNQYNSKYDIDNLIMEFSLKDIETNTFSTLSNGEKRRFLFILLLLKNPIMMVLDEPFAELDSNNRALITTYLNKLKQNHLIILTSHCKIENLMVDKEMNVHHLELDDDNEEGETIVSSNIHTNKFNYKQNYFNIIFILIFTFIYSLFFPFVFETHGDFIKKQCELHNSKVAYVGRNTDDNIVEIIETINQYQYPIMYKVKIDNPLSEEFDAIGMYNNPVIYNLDNSNLLNSNEIIISDMFAATYIYDRFVENKKDYLSSETNNYMSLLNKIILVNNKEYKVIKIIDTGAYSYHKEKNYVELYFTKFVSYAIINDNFQEDQLDKQNVFVYFDDLFNVDSFIDDLERKNIYQLEFEDQLTLINGNEFVIRKFIKVIIYVFIAVLTIALIIAYTIFIRKKKEEYHKIRILTKLFFFDYNLTIKDIYKKNVLKYIIASIFMVILYISIILILQNLINYISVQLVSVVVLIILLLVLLITKSLIYRGSYDRN